MSRYMFWLGADDRTAAALSPPPKLTFWLGAEAKPPLVFANGAKLNVVMWPEGMPVWACSYFKSVWDNLQRQGAT